MSVSHINEALGAVQQLKQNLLDKQRFKGFSGPVRMVSGAMALTAAPIMAAPFYPMRGRYYILGWAAVFLVAFLLNVIALIAWYLNDKKVQRDITLLKPTLDVIPPLFVGALLTGVLFYHKDFQYLYGMWMCMFGLTNLASRYVLPPLISVVGLFYIVAGIVCLVATDHMFPNPWPMGIVFFIGETAGGMILYHDRRRYASFDRYMKNKDREKKEAIA